MKITARALVRAPLETVFDFMADTRNDERWAPLVSAVQQVKGKSPKVGAKYEFTQKAGTRSLQMTIEITQFERPALVQWTGKTRAGSYISTMVFAPLAKGTLVKQTNDVDYGVKGLKSVAMKVIATRVLATQMRRVRKILEKAPSEAA